MKSIVRKFANLIVRAVVLAGLLLAALPATGVSAATYTLSITGGNPQTASTNAAFANPLQVRVTRTILGIPVGVNGATVTYTVPGSGASAVLSSSTAITASSGLNAGYASVTATANGTAGLYAVTAQVTNGNTSNSVSFNLTNVDTPFVSAITLAGTSPTNATSVDFNVAFTQPVSPVVAADFSLTTSGGESGASVTNVTPTSGFNANYVVSVATVPGAGTIRLDVTDTDATIKNTSGHSLGNIPYTVGPSYTIDRVAPTVVSITRVSASPTELGTVSFTVTFSEPVSGVTASAFSLVTTGGISGANITNLICLTSTSCIVIVSTGSGDGTVGLNLVASPGITDSVGNTIAGPFTGEVYLVIKSAPVVLSINRAGTNPTNASSVDFTVTFSEDVSGVDTTDFVTSFDGSLSGTSVTSVTPVSASVYTVTVNTGSGSGTLGLNLVDNDSIRDFANPIPHDLGGLGIGNGSHTGDQAYTIDRIAPTVTVEQAAGQSDPTNATPINFTATFSQAIDTSTFTADDVTLAGTAGATTVIVSEIAPNDGTTFNIAVSGMTGSGTVVASLGASVVIDLAGNANTASTSTDNTVTYDITVPTVAVEQAAGQPDPTNASPINFTATFSKPINTSTFTAGDVNLNGGTAPGALTDVISEIAPNDGTTFNIAVSGMTGSGTVMASLDASVVTDTIGNANTASTSTDDTVTYDTVLPAVTSILRHIPTSSPTNASNVTFRVTFSKDVQNVDLTDFSLALTGTASGTLNTVTPVSTSVYDVNIITVDGNGTLGLEFAAGNNIADLADNPLGASPTIGTDENYLIDNTNIIVIDKGVIGYPGTVTILNGSRYNRHFTSLEVLFNKDANDPASDSDPEDVTNPYNYLLLQAGPNKVYDTVSCKAYAGGSLPIGDDIKIPTGPVTYDNHGGAGPFVASVTVNNGNPLPAGEYRLLICGTTSITDLAGNPLNGGVDSILTFHIYDPAPAAARVPSTGFAPERVTALPGQPAKQAYTAMSDLWLDVPRLGVRMNIVGVPQSTDGTWDVSWLGSDAGWLNGSAYPTWNGNSVLAGHVFDADGQPGPFVHLNQLWWGDQVIVHAGGAQYVYEVRSVLQVGPQDVSAMLQHEESPWLTLVTCRGYDEASNSYQYRVLVRAVLVAVK